MNEIRVAAIVGGHGEVEAVPILFRRIAADIDQSLNVQVKPVLRVPETCLARPDGLEKPIELAARKIGGQGGIFILADCDRPDGCPKHDAPVWLSRARHARSDLPISVVLACQEYEAWFIAAAESLRGRRGLAMDIRLRPEAGEHPRGQGVAE